MNRRTYGDYFFALSVTVCAMITTNKVFFMAAILMMALADGLAALAGKKFGKRLKYTVFGQTKTGVGTMTFWFTAVCILDIASLLAHNSLVYNHYYWLILLLPPGLTIVENLGVYGLDNLLVPVLTVVVLRLAQA
ncbi:MAG TPA: hypothetical protein VFP35_00915 [Candidatus Saccharimonadales bacterium]|nr:hypothetical protein [Candidatus Saccharimonadales bacterium]